VVINPFTSSEYGNRPTTGAKRGIESRHTTCVARATIKPYQP